jgi:hypothetical protein
MFHSLFPALTCVMFLACSYASTARLFSTLTLFVAEEEKRRGPRLEGEPRGRALILALTLPSWPRASIYDLWCRHAAPTWMSRRTFAACSQFGAADPQLALCANIEETGKHFP